MPEVIIGSPLNIDTLVDGDYIHNLFVRELKTYYKVNGTTYLNDWRSFNSPNLFDIISGGLTQNSGINYTNTGMEASGYEFTDDHFVVTDPGMLQELQLEE